MKIAHISTAKVGGAGIAAFRIHQGLLKYGNGIHSSFVQKIQNPDEALNIYRCTQFHNLYYRVVNRLGLRSYLTKEGRYKRIISGYPLNYEIITCPVSYYPIEEHPIVKQADIIHLHWVGEFLNYPSFFKKIKQPVVWTLHDMNPFSGVFHYEGDKYRNQEELGYLDAKIAKKKADFIRQKENITIVSPSNWLKLKSQQSEILGRYPHYLFPYGIDNTEYPLLEKKDAVIKLKIDNKKKNILFIAQRIDIYRKGLDLLIDTLNNIDCNKFNLIAVGGGNLDSRINKNINIIKLDHINSISDLNTVYSAADITIIPSREDNLPNTMLESFMNGTPVISFSNGGMAEHIRTGENGILVNEINAKALTSAILDFIEDKYIFRRGLIKQYAVQTFSDHLQAKNYIELYNKIIDKR